MRVFGVKRAYDDNITAIGSGRRLFCHSHLMTADVAELRYLPTQITHGSRDGSNSKYLKENMPSEYGPRSNEPTHLQGLSSILEDTAESVIIEGDEMATFVAPLWIPCSSTGSDDREPC